jgi:dsDNA-specific endonuclease/ATPase MutS2
MRLFDWFKRRKAAVEEDASDDRWQDSSDPFPDPSSIPVRDVLDLHGLPPKMVREVVESYVEEARRLGFRYVRIVHGKGIGVQREVVRSVLGRTTWVESFGDAPAEAGGWGATVARLSVDVVNGGEDLVATEPVSDDDPAHAGGVEGRDRSSVD